MAKALIERPVQLSESSADTQKPQCDVALSWRLLPHTADSDVKKNTQIVECYSDLLRSGIGGDDAGQLCAAARAVHGTCITVLLVSH